MRAKPEYVYFCNRFYRLVLWGSLHIIRADAVCCGRRPRSDTLLERWSASKDKYVAVTCSKKLSNNDTRMDFKVSLKFLHANQIMLHRLIVFILSTPVSECNAEGYAAFKQRYPDEDIHCEHATGKWWELRRDHLCLLDGITNRSLGGVKRRRLTEASSA